MNKYYNENAEETNIENSIYGFTVTDRNTRYFIKSNGTQLYDPFNKSSIINHRMTWKLKEFNERVFRFYEQFILTGESKLKLYAERAI